MSLLALIIFLVIMGLVFWLVTAYLLPIVPQPFRTVILVVLVLIAIVWLLEIAGVVTGIRIR
jgi:hypothetical protein